MKAARVPHLAKLLLVCVGCLPGGHSQAAGFREYQDSWLLDREHIWYLLDETTTSTSAHELFLPEETWFSCAVGQGRLFSLPELEQRYLGIRLGGGVLGQDYHLSGDWQILGNDLYRQTRQEVEIKWGRLWVLGVQLRRETEIMESQLVGSNTKSALLISRWWHAATTLSSSLAVRFDLHLDLNTGTPSAPVNGRRPFACMTCFLFGSAVVLQLDRRGDDSPVVGFDFVWNAGSGLGLSMRVDPTTGTLGPGILYRRGHLLLTSSHLVHPHLGQTHRLGLGFHG